MGIGMSFLSIHLRTRQLALSILYCPNSTKHGHPHAYPSYAFIGLGSISSTLSVVFPSWGHHLDKADHSHLHGLEPSTCRSRYRFSTPTLLAHVLLLFTHSNEYHSKHTGLGFDNEDSNVFTWLDYLGTTKIRVFVQPLLASTAPSLDAKRWRQYASNNYSASRFQQYGDQFGVDFDGNPVVDQDSWLSAVSSLRNQTTPREIDFFEWLDGQKPINWTLILKTLNTTSTNSPYLAQSGNPASTVFKLIANNYNVVALWDIRCNSLPFQSFNTSDPMYWRERWEQYRLYYIGGRWMSFYRVPEIELYNEPDHDTTCMTPAAWADTSRIISQALQDGYKDTALNGYDAIPLTLYAPASASSFPTKTAPNSVLFQYMNTPFPGNTTNDSFKLINSYSFHRYGSFSKSPTCTTITNACRPSTGYQLRQAYDRVLRDLGKAGNGDMPVAISEFNSYLYAITDNASLPFFAGNHIFDVPATAAALAGQVAGFSTEPNAPPAFISVHKMVQTLGRSGSYQSKNGLFYADISGIPFSVNGPTMTGETYRLLIKHAGGNQKTLGFNSRSFAINNGSRLSVFATQDNINIYTYIVNEQTSEQTIDLDMSALNVDPSSWVVVSGTGFNAAYNSNSVFYGEVAFQQYLNGSQRMKFDMPPGNVYCLTFPKVKTAVLAMEPIADATLTAKAPYLTGKSTKQIVNNGTTLNQTVVGVLDSLQVSSADTPSVAVLRFDVPNTNSAPISSAVLSLHLDFASNNDYQVVTVLAIDTEWDEQTVTWNHFNILKPDPSYVLTTKDNYINWFANPPPKPVGQIVIPPGGLIPANGTDIQLDVSEAIADNIYSFLVVRLMRYDNSAGEPPLQLSADSIEGWYTFGSQEAVEPWRRPQLLVQYQIPDTPPAPTPIPTPSPSS